MYGYGNSYAPMAYGGAPTGFAGGTTAFSGGGYNFTTLVALILIVLVFGHKSYGKDGCRDGHGGTIDKSILFIIAFFFLACGCGGGCAPAMPIAQPMPMRRPCGCGGGY